jgi:hypothetical protein
VSYGSIGEAPSKGLVLTNSALRGSAAALARDIIPAVDVPEEMGASSLPRASGGPHYLH